MTTVDHIRAVARDPIGHHGLYNRTPEALQVIEATNASQIEADERGESWLARNGLRVMAALMIAVFVAVTAARAADKLDADLTLYHQFRSMK